MGIRGGIQILCSREFHKFFEMYIDYGKQNKWQELFQMMRQFDQLETKCRKQAQQIENLAKQIHECQYQYGQISAQLSDVQRRISEREKRKKEPYQNTAVKREKKIVKPQQDPARHVQSNHSFCIRRNKDNYFITQKNIGQAVSKLADTSVLDVFFANVPDTDAFKKMYVRFCKNLKKWLESCEVDDDMEDILYPFVNIVQNELIKKIMVAVYRGMKSGNGESERKLLEVVNQYLEQVGFYCRTDIQVGGILCDRDYEDMDFIRDDKTLGRQHGEIIEIVFYPYYLNYIDENGTKKCIHTQGKIIVIA